MSGGFLTYTVHFKHIIYTPCLKKVAHYIHMFAKF